MSKITASENRNDILIEPVTGTTYAGDNKKALDVHVLGGIVPITGSGTFALTPAVTLNALAYMTAEAGGPTPLSPEGLANAVLDALLADHTSTGTVGEALNNVGASGNPWSSDLSTNNTAGTFGEKIQKLLSTDDFIGLK